MKLPRSTRLLLYAALRRMPRRVQKLLFYLGSPKVTLGASAVIWDGERLLVVRHTYRQPAWGLPSGLIGHGEQPGPALARELREELGAGAIVGPLLHAETDIATRHLTLYFSVTLSGAPSLDGEEIDQFRYVTMAELASLIGRPAPTWLAVLPGGSGSPSGDRPHLR